MSGTFASLGSEVFARSLYKVLDREYQQHKTEIKLLSSNRPTGPIQSSSRNVRVSVCVFDVPFHVVYFEAYFSSTSRSQMSKNFTDSESLGKSAGKKWSQN